MEDHLKEFELEDYQKDILRNEPSEDLANSEENETKAAYHDVFPSKRSDFKCESQLLSFQGTKTSI